MCVCMCWCVSQCISLCVCEGSEGRSNWCCWTGKWGPEDEDSAVLREENMFWIQTDLASGTCSTTDGLENPDNYATSAILSFII